MFDDDPLMELERELAPVPPEAEALAAGPSMLIVLVSSASGISGGTLGFYVSFSMLGLSVPLSAGVATFALLMALGISGATLSALTGSRAAPSNILFSCGLIVIILLFFVVCTLVGAIVAVLLVSL